METKQTIPAGTKYGRMTYISEAGFIKGNRYVKMLCTCGRDKNMPFSYLARPETLSCNNMICRNRVINHLESLVNQKLKRIQNLDIIIERKDFKANVDIEHNRELSDLTAYWREIELTGNVHNVAKGLEMTTDFLKQ